MSRPERGQFVVSVSRQVESVAREVAKIFHCEPSIVIAIILDTWVEHNHPEGIEDLVGEWVGEAIKCKFAPPKGKRRKMTQEKK